MNIDYKEYFKKYGLKNTLILGNENTGQEQLLKGMILNDHINMKKNIIVGNNLNILNTVDFVGGEIYEEEKYCRLKSCSTLIRNLSARDNAEKLDSLHKLMEIGYIEGISKVYISEQKVSKLILENLNLFKDIKNKVVLILNIEDSLVPTINNDIINYFSIMLIGDLNEKVCKELSKLIKKEDLLNSEEYLPIGCFQIIENHRKDYEI